MPDLVMLGGGFAAPTPVGARRSGSLDAVRLERAADGRVVRSTRILTASASDERFRRCAEAVDAALTAVLAASDVPASGLQSAVASVRHRYHGDESSPQWRTNVVARVETVHGPVLLGAPGVELDAAAFRLLRELPQVTGAPRDWRDRSLVIGPAVAALIVSAARLALTSRSGRTVLGDHAGRRILPGLTLLDVPIAHAEGTLDDAGATAATVALVSDGCGRKLPFDARTGAIEGRAVWDHDQQEPSAASVTRLELSGPKTTPPSDAVQLVWVLEGLQRYHLRGEVRLSCLARAEDQPATWFVVELRGRPLSILRSVTGIGPADADIFTDTEVRTGPLVLAGADELRQKGGISVANL